MSWNRSAYLTHKRNNKKTNLNEKTKSVKDLKYKKII